MAVVAEQVGQPQASCHVEDPLDQRPYPRLLLVDAEQLDGGPVYLTADPGLEGDDPFAQLRLRSRGHPQGQGRPGGRFVRLAGTPRYVSLDAVTVKEAAPVDKVDASAIKAASAVCPSSSNITRSWWRVTNIGVPIGRQPCATMASTSRLPRSATPTIPRWCAAC